MPQSTISLNSGHGATLQEINPRYLIPGRRTGWQVTHQIARAMPNAFIANSQQCWHKLRIVACEGATYIHTK